MSEFYIGILMGLNGVIIVMIEMVLIFHLESKNRTLYFISQGLILTVLSFLVYVLLPLHPATALISVVLVTIGEILAMPFMNNYWAGGLHPATAGSMPDTMRWPGLFPR